MFSTVSSMSWIVCWASFHKVLANAKLVTTLAKIKTINILVIINVELYSFKIKLKWKFSKVSKAWTRKILHCWLRNLDFFETVPKKFSIYTYDFVWFQSRIAYKLTDLFSPIYFLRKKWDFQDDFQTPWQLNSKLFKCSIIFVAYDSWE